MTDLQTIVLGVMNKHCGPDSGWCTGELATFIGRQPGHESNRLHSLLVGRTLRELEAMGHVRRLDDESPIVWCRKDY